MPGEENWNIKDLLKQTNTFRTNPELIDSALAIFDFTKFLVDNDDNLTKTGNLNAKGKRLLHERIQELLSESTIDQADLEEVN